MRDSVHCRRIRHMDYQGKTTELMECAGLVALLLRYYATEYTHSVLATHGVTSVPTR